MQLGESGFCLASRPVGGRSVVQIVQVQVSSDYAAYCCIGNTKQAAFLTMHLKNADMEVLAC